MSRESVQESSEGSGMNPTLFKAFIALGLVSLFVVWFGVTFLRNRTLSSLLQLGGSGCLLIVVLTHVCEALHLLPTMGWGKPDSLGHYIDLSSAVLGVALLSNGYILQWRKRPSGREP
jgi:uncharacterized membrane protein